MNAAVLPRHRAIQALLPLHNREIQGQLAADQVSVPTLHVRCLSPAQRLLIREKHDSCGAVAVEYYARCYRESLQTGLYPVGYAEPG